MNEGKNKIFNDPVYGFISVPHPIILELIEHPYFQRLRRILQTGLSYYVYPGCTHTRFLHALGCLHLMQDAVRTLRHKDIDITEDEELGVYIAILLHDIGHGPFSHTLENTLVQGITHEEISIRIMNRLNQEFNGKLTKAIEIFTGNYPKVFLTELISSQLDIDRLDYLKRDSFFSGVAEGNINSDRIISMLNVIDGRLVVDGKGIHSVEKFLISRMFMYWQVYFHKTSVAAEVFLISALNRARFCCAEKKSQLVSSSLNYFLHREENPIFSEQDLDEFLKMDDSDIFMGLKVWQKSSDEILSTLSRAIVSRRLPKAQIRKEPITEEELSEYRVFIAEHFKSEMADTYFLQQTELKIQPYNPTEHPISVVDKKGNVIPLTSSDQQIMGNSLVQQTVKHHICYWDIRKLNRFKAI